MTTPCQEIQPDKNPQQPAQPELALWLSSQKKYQDDTQSLFVQEETGYVINQIFSAPGGSPAQGYPTGLGVKMLEEALPAH